MQIRFQLLDDDNSLVSGRFDSFFYSEMIILIIDETQTVELKVMTAHKTFLITLCARIIELLKNNTSFRIDSFGYLEEYRFQLIDNKIHLTERKNKVEGLFNKVEFLKNLKLLMEDYLTFIKKHNPDVINSYEFKELFLAFKSLKDYK